MTSIKPIPATIQSPELNLQPQFGMHGAAILDLSANGVPYSPGVIANIPQPSDYTDTTIETLTLHSISQIEASTDLQFGGNEAGLTVSLSLLPDMILDKYPQILYLGLTDQTLPKISVQCGELSTYQAYQQLIETYAQHCFGISDFDLNGVREGIDSDDHQAICQGYLTQLVPNFPQTAIEQLQLALKSLIDAYYSNFYIEDSSASLYISYLPCTSPKSKTFYGAFTSRDMLDDAGIDSTIIAEDIPNRDHLTTELKWISTILEKHYLAVRDISFFIASGNLYISGQKQSQDTSSRSRIHLLNDLLGKNEISEKTYLSNINPDELRDLLHPTVDTQSTQHLDTMQGGIAGSPGAATGKVYFSSKSLLEAAHQAQLSGEDEQFILMKNRTGREDIQAIEKCHGIITSEGGYASHAPIIARYLGKPAAVFPGISFSGRQAKLHKYPISEGTTLTLMVPNSDPPTICFGKAVLIYPDAGETVLGKLLHTAKKYISGITIMANADTPADARTAFGFGAEGVGLCRTENLLLAEDNSQAFRAVMLADDSATYQEKLEDIRQNLIDGFIHLFDILADKPLIIRLMDAPLSEFFPPESGIVRFQEKNPMLGLRGCRAGITYPDLYSLQVQAILEAALETTRDKQYEVAPHIMIPFVISVEEIEILKYGEKIEESARGGINREIEAVQSKHGITQLPFELKVGAMIELPAAAITAGDISTQVEFLSFGTNDLTQTVLGVSRDDLNSFLPTYIAKGVWKNDPFQTLADPVKVLIAQAVRDSRQIRPDLMLGICGEQGAQSDVIRFCIDQGLNYISCPPYEVPLAILAAAQIILNKS